MCVSQLPVECLMRVIQLLVIVEDIEQCVGIESQIFIALSTQWWHALHLTWKAGRSSAKFVYDRVSARGTIDIFHRLRCGPPCRCRIPLRWRWLAFRVMKNRLLLCSSSVELPIYNERSKGFFNAYLAEAVFDAKQYPVFRYEDILGIYKTPSRYLCFNEFEAVCDLLLSAGGQHLSRCTRLQLYTKKRVEDVGTWRRLQQNRRN